MTTVALSAAMRRARCRNLVRVGATLGGVSDRTRPAEATCRSMSALPIGYARSMPEARTAMVAPSPASTALVAAASMP